MINNSLFSPKNVRPVLGLFLVLFSVSDIPCFQHSYSPVATDARLRRRLYLSFISLFLLNVSDFSPFDSAIAVLVSLTLKSPLMGYRSFPTLVVSVLGSRYEK